MAGNNNEANILEYIKFSVELEKILNFSRLPNCLNPMFDKMEEFQKIGRHYEGRVLNNQISFESPDWKLEPFWVAQLKISAQLDLILILHIDFKAQGFNRSPQTHLGTWWTS